MIYEPILDTWAKEEHEENNLRKTTLVSVGERDWVKVLCPTNGYSGHLDWGGGLEQGSGSAKGKERMDPEHFKLKM